MTKEQVLNDISSLISDIDKCTDEVIKARWETKDKDQEGKAIGRMESLMVAAHQELSSLYDYIGGLWKDAQGDELPEIDREVIALVGKSPYFKVVCAHRPDPERKVFISIVTGKKGHFQPKIYDKGGWNIPNIKYYLDLDLPIEEGGKE